MVLCFLFAFVMQIDANFVNDYFDFKRGNDDETRLGPERACAQGWVTPSAMVKALLLTTVLACFVGLPLIIYGGLEMISIGIACVVFCFLYTTTLSYIAMGDVLVLLFFGLVPVCVTYYVQLHTVTAAVLIASLACGLVIDALLLVNNFRDRDTDAQAGKLTLVVRIGASAAHKLYLLTGVTACLLGLVFLVEGRVLAFLLPFIYAALHVGTWVKMKAIWQGRALNGILGETARNIFVYGLLVAVGILLGI
jgi:1,4-dihydroxy-2-naphthoate octaprenyltransferase